MAQSWEDTYDEARRKSLDTKRIMIIRNIKEKVPDVDPDLVFLTPTELLKAMDDNQVVTSFHRRLLNEYECPERRYGLLFPDAERMPWLKGSTTAQIYRNLYTSLKNLELEEDVALFSISPLLGVIPSEWYEGMPIYDSSGAASFMVRRRGLAWNAEDFRAVISRAAEILVAFLERNHPRCGSWHIIYRKDSIHQRIFQIAQERRPFSVWPHVSKKSLAVSYLKVKELVGELKKY